MDYTLYLQRMLRPIFKFGRSTCAPADAPTSVACWIALRAPSPPGVLRVNPPGLACKYFNNFTIVATNSLQWNVCRWLLVYTIYCVIRSAYELCGAHFTALPPLLRLSIHGFFTPSAVRLFWLPLPNSMLFLFLFYEDCVCNSVAEYGPFSGHPKFSSYSFYCCLNIFCFKITMKMSVITLVSFILKD